MLIVQYLPWLVTMSLPLLFAMLVRQPWKSRPFFVVVGVLVAFSICNIAVFVAGIGLMQLYPALGINTSMWPRPVGTPIYMQFNQAFYYVFNIGLTYWVLRRLAPFFRAPIERHA